LRINEEVNLPREVKTMRKIQDRTITRANKKKYNQEERLDSKTAFGISDPTPRAAVKNMIERGKANEM